MTKTKLVSFLFAGVAGLVLLGSTALAQSSIAGTAKDASGAVMPGVKVEAASPVLIEGARTVTTGTMAGTRLSTSGPAPTRSLSPCRGSPP